MTLNKIPLMKNWSLALCLLLTAPFTASVPIISDPPPSIDVTQPPAEGLTGHFLYVATPGIRNYLGYGGHGLLVFDIDNNHKFVKRIATKGLKADGTPSNVKGIAVSPQLNSVYISTLEALQRIDLKTEEVVWEIPYEGGCDRMNISPDGLTMYLPSLEKDFWNVVDCRNGEIITKLKVHSRAHNTIYGPSGKHAYLADIGSPDLYVTDTETHTIAKTVGPFSAGIRPFTINSDESLVYATVNELLGFEVGDLKTGEKLAGIQVQGWDKGPVRRHGNPSHGIALTPDETEVWLCDGHNMRLHLFDAQPPYQQLTTIALDDMPGWITFSMDGQYAYPSSGEVIHAKTRKVLYLLQDERYNTVSSEKMVEVFMKNGRVVKAGDQFGVGRLHGWN
jgi:DNA-binding beta-propeller fold protein YncE